jgi:hypothetical protein
MSEWMGGHSVPTVVASAAGRISDTPNRQALPALVCSIQENDQLHTARNLSWHDARPMKKKKTSSAWPPRDNLPTLVIRLTLLQDMLHNISDAQRSATRDTDEGHEWKKKWTNMALYPCQNSGCIYAQHRGPFRNMLQQLRLSADKRRRLR